jgi:hypothetical protein
VFSALRPSGGAGQRRRLQLPSRTASESGFALVEVLVSSALLVLIALGIYTGIDGASGISGVSKARSIAASLAQQDLDRVRGLRLSELTTLNESNAQTAGGLSFTVVSRAEWVNDSTGTVGEACAPGGSTLHYIKAFSTVTWPRMGAALPVRLESLIPVTASSYGSQGNLAVSVRNQAGSAMTAQSVTATGPGGTTRTVPTSSTGCAYFDFLPIGSYAFSFSRPGYVDTSGAASVSRTVSVNAGGTVAQDVLYDQAGQVRGNFETVRPGLAAGSTVTSTATAFHLSAERHGSAPSGAAVPPGTWADSQVAAASSITTPRVFYPFPTAYRVYAGNCANNQPPVGTTLGSVVVTPNASPADVAVRVPAINIRVTNSSNATVTTGTAARVTPTGTTGCTGTVPTYLPQTTVTTAQSTALNAPVGSLPNPGFPWGTYDVCAQLTYSGTVWRNTVSVANTNIAGTTPTTVIKVNNTASGKNVKGACP